MIKMVVSDIDGTLLKEGTSELKKEYFEIFEKLYDKGVKVVIASGRNYVEIDSIFHPLKDKAYFICCNGASIVYKEKIIYKKVMNSKKLEMMVSFIRNDEVMNKHPLLTSLLDHSHYAENKAKEQLSFLSAGYRSRCIFVDDLLPYAKNCVKVNIFDDTLIDRNLICGTLIKKFGKDFNVVVSGKRWIDICDKEATKGIALKYLQKKFGIKKDEIVCMGDNCNDVSMLRCAKYSFVPSISADEIKKEAKYIMPSYEYDGPLQVLKAVYDFGI